MHIAAQLLAAFALLVLAACAESDSASAGTLTILSGGQDHVFSIELADTDETRRKGLMFRESLSPDAGMLFDFGETRMVSMWMRNTPLSLDMIFIGEDGRIRHIAERTVPYSEATISSQVPVAAVLEVRGGTAERIGLRIGDRVRHPIFETPEAGE